MSYNLFLDDFRNPMCLRITLTWEIVRNYKGFVKIIEERGLPQLISFDHDLCLEDINKQNDFKEKTGYDCAVWLIEYCMRTNQKLPKWQVHSLNPVGRSNIQSILENFEKKEEFNE